MSSSILVGVVFPVAHRQRLTILLDDDSIRRRCCNEEFRYDVEVLVERMNDRELIAFGTDQSGIAPIQQRPRRVVPPRNAAGENVDTPGVVGAQMDHEVPSVKNSVAQSVAVGDVVVGEEPSRPGANR